MDFVKELLSVLFVLAISVFIIWLAYISTKAIAKSGLIRQQSTKNIEVLESMTIGRDKQLVIARVCGEMLLLGVTQNHIELISTIDGEEFVEEQKPKADGPMPFSDALKKVMKDKFKK